MKKKLLLINPALENEINFNQQIPILRLPPLSLGYLAALTPDDWEVEAVDENMQRLNGQEADLAAITSFTHNSPRAYEIASEFRKKGIPTIMGGIHASMLPEEASKFADSVYIGEAETEWRQVIKDFEKNRLQKIYHGGIASLESLVQPRRDIYPKGYFTKSTVQTARGCPGPCDFCSVRVYNGFEIRNRSIDSIMAEIESLDLRVVVDPLGLVTMKALLFADDDIVGYRNQSKARAIGLFSKMAERYPSLIWGSQTSIYFGNDE
jgi:radical SAM superfamily enzyme YgiQ (UPF0313 family)